MKNAYFFLLEQKYQQCQRWSVVEKTIFYFILLAKAIFTFSFRVIKAHWMKNTCMLLILIDRPIWNEIYSVHMTMSNIHCLLHYMDVKCVYQIRFLFVLSMDLDYLHENCAWIVPCSWIVFIHMSLQLRLIHKMTRYNVIEWIVSILLTMSN